MVGRLRDGGAGHSPLFTRNQRHPGRETQVWPRLLTHLFVWVLYWTSFLAGPTPRRAPHYGLQQRAATRQYTLSVTWTRHVYWRPRRPPNLPPRRLRRLFRHHSGSLTSKRTPFTNWRFPTTRPHALPGVNPVFLDPSGFQLPDPLESWTDHSAALSGATALWAFTQYGCSDLDALLDLLNPLQQFRLLDAMSTWATPVTAPDLVNSHVAELYARTLSAPSSTVALDTTVAYLATPGDSIPVVLDTSASVSITPVLSDFVTNLKLAGSRALCGLNDATADVIGVGLVAWSVRDTHGTVHVLCTPAYYIPNATVKLFSPQAYFQSCGGGSCVVTRHNVALTLSEGTTLHFPYQPGRNLPFMLPSLRSSKPQPFVGLTVPDLLPLHTEPLFQGHLSVMDETNQNITSSQKELLLWHQRCGHANFSWIQSLCQTNCNAKATILPTRSPSVSTCPAPLCTACQLAKQKRHTPDNMLPGLKPAGATSLSRSSRSRNLCVP